MGGMGWKKITTPSINRIFLYDNKIFGLGDDQAIWQADNNSGETPKKWSRITTGSVTNFAISCGIIYGVGLDKAIWKHPLVGGAWQKITSPSVSDLVIGPNQRNIFGIGDDQAIWRSNIDGVPWQRVTTGSVTSFTIYNGKFYGVGLDNCVYACKQGGTGNWERITGGSVTRIKIHNNKIYGIGLDHAVWEHPLHNPNGNWMKLTSECVREFGVMHNPSRSRFQFFGIGLDKAVWAHDIP